MRVVVTGATGNVGTALLRALGDEDGGRRDRRHRPPAPGRRAAAEDDAGRPPTSPATTSSRCSRGADCRRPPRLAHPALARRGRHVRDERRGQRAGVRGGRPRRRAGARLRLVGRRRTRPGPKDRARRRVVAHDRRSRRSFYSRHKAAVERELSTLRGRPPRGPRRPAAPRPDLPARAPRPGSGGCSPGRSCPSPLVRRELVPVRPAPPAAARAGRPRRRRRRRLPARDRRDRRARRVQHRRRAAARRRRRRAARSTPARSTSRPRVAARRRRR